METKQIVTTLAAAMREELIGNILPFWMNRLPDTQRGGFFGQIDGLGTLHHDAPRGAVLNTRLLWTYSAAYRITGDPAYLATATRAKEYIDRHFTDPEYGGIYWSVDADGQPLDTKKQIYALGFAIYGMSEYVRATGDGCALSEAIGLFESIEAHAYDPIYGGYYEAFARDWTAIGDMRLSDKDSNECKTMNTHLHILEPYTNLYRVWKDPRLAERIRALITIFCEQIIDSKTGHLNLFFGDAWDCRSSIQSFGHDIEGSWLIHEAALELGDEALLAKVEPVIRRIAEAAAEGLQADGSIVYERDPTTGHTDCDRHWWPQAETVVGYFNLYAHFTDVQALHRAEAAWRYIQAQIIDRQGGEWFWSRKADGTAHTGEGGDKAGFWKCPYHNSRMCLEIMERTAKMEKR